MAEKVEDRDPITVYVVRYCHGDPKGVSSPQTLPDCGIHGRFEQEEDALKGQLLCEQYLLARDKDQGVRRESHVWIQELKLLSVGSPVQSTLALLKKDSEPWKLKSVLAGGAA